MLIRAKVDGNDVWINPAYLRQEMQNSGDGHQLSLNKNMTAAECFRYMLAWLAVFGDRFRTRDFLELLNMLMDALWDFREEYEGYLDDENEGPG